MKKSDKLILLLFFVLLNLGAAFIISRFFQLSWAVIAVSMVVALAIIDLPGMIRNRKIKKAQRKASEEQRKAHEERMKKKQEDRELADKKREEAVKRQRRLTERNMQNRSKH
jgi:ABC-type multidrug transport system fused ATPase/permease subunit